MRLKEMRTNKGLLQRDIAEVLNCSTPVYCRYEKGEREPPFDVIKILADYYGVTVDYLLGRDDPPASLEPKEAPADDRAEAKQILNDLPDKQYQAALEYLKLLRSIN